MAALVRGEAVDLTSEKLFPKKDWGAKRLQIERAHGGKVIEHGLRALSVLQQRGFPCHYVCLCYLSRIAVSDVRGEAVHSPTEFVGCPLWRFAVCLPLLKHRLKCWSRTIRLGRRRRRLVEVNVGKGRIEGPKQQMAIKPFSVALRQLEAGAAFVSALPRGSSSEAQP